MDCTTLQAILSGQADADLGDAESQAFEAHLRACDACREALAQAEGELEPLVERMEPPALPEAAWDRVTQAVKDSVVSRRETTREPARPALVVHAGGASGTRFPRGVAIAAAFLIAVGIGALLPLDMFKGLNGSAVSATPGGPIDINPAPPPAPRPLNPDDRGAPSTASTPALVVGTHAEVRRLEFDAGRFDATAIVYDCGDEDVVLISVRDL